VLSDPDRRKNYDEFGPDSLHSGFDAERARAFRQAGGGFGGGFPRGGARGGFPGFGGFGGFGGEGMEFDLGDLLGGGARRRAPPTREAAVHLELGQALAGVEVVVDGQRVRIPPGADDGSVVKLTTPQGPLRITIHVRPHPHFQREGLDLVLRLPVTLGELAVGAAIEVPTPAGPVTLKVPPRTRAGARLRLRGKGVARKDHTGDLYVELSLRLPEQWDDALVAACQAAEPLYTTPVREGVAL
jgi:curved DNA-binding protein